MCEPDLFFVTTHTSEKQIFTQQAIKYTEWVGSK